MAVNWRKVTHNHLSIQLKLPFRHQTKALNVLNEIIRSYQDCNLSNNKSKIDFFCSLAAKGFSDIFVQVLIYDGSQSNKLLIQILKGAPTDDKIADQGKRNPNNII